MSAESKHEEAEVPSIWEWWGLTPDAQEQCSTDLFESVYAAPFDGPGWYVLGTLYLLVVPARATQAWVWHWKYEGALHVYRWDRPNGVPPWETFNAVCNAPVRQGES